MTLTEVPKQLLPAKEKESSTGVFIILSTVASFPCYFRENHFSTAGKTCTHTAPEELHRGRPWGWEPQKKRGLQVQKVTAGPVVSEQLHRSPSLPRVRYQTPRDKADEAWHSGQGTSSVWESCPGEQQLKRFQCPLTRPPLWPAGTELAHPCQCSTR